jgi:hypothetical protein
LLPAGTRISAGAGGGVTRSARAGRAGPTVKAPASAMMHAAGRMRREFLFVDALRFFM